MENQKQTIDNLMNVMVDYMRDIHRCEKTIFRYHRQWQKVKNFMLSNKIEYYDSDVEKTFLTSLLGEFDYNQLNLKEKELVNAIESLSEFQKSGRILMGQRKHQKRIFKGDSGRIINEFIAHREDTLKLSNLTIQNYVIYLYSFYCHMNCTGVKDITEIKVSDILSYIEKMNHDALAKMHVSLNVLRIFFRYLYEYSILSVD